MRKPSPRKDVMPPRKPLSPPSSSDAARQDHRARLVSLRDRLTPELEAAPPASVAGLARQLQAVLNELATMADPTAPPSTLDAIVASRNARRQDAARAGGGSP